MFGISGEHLLILAIVLLIFGPKRLPELGNTMGKAMKNFKDALSGVEEAKFRRLEEEKAEKLSHQAKVPAGATTADSAIDPAPINSVKLDQISASDPRSINGPDHRGPGPSLQA